jgi:hypothetical protein
MDEAVESLGKGELPDAPARTHVFPLSPSTKVKRSSARGGASGLRLHAAEIGDQVRPVLLAHFAR